jgi:hypothetical protein
MWTVSSAGRKLGISSIAGRLVALADHRQASGAKLGHLPA